MAGLLLDPRLPDLLLLEGEIPFFVQSRNYPKASQSRIAMEALVHHQRDPRRRLGHRQEDPPSDVPQL